MLVAAIASTFMLLAAVVFGLLFFAVRENPYGSRWSRRMLGAGFLVCAVLPIVVIGLLWFAQREVCSALGGGWIPSEASCKNEWGGNGNNDPSNTKYPLPDPVHRDER